jgi:hypothetical protein
MVGHKRVVEADTGSAVQDLCMEVLQSPSNRTPKLSCRTLKPQLGL